MRMNYELLKQKSVQLIWEIDSDFDSAKVKLMNIIFNETTLLE